MGDSLHQQAQNFLGTSIEAHEWEIAKLYAELKIRAIMEQQTDEFEQENIDDLLAQLIAETVQNYRVSRFTYTLSRSYHYAKKQAGVKKKARV